MLSIYIPAAAVFILGLSWPETELEKVIIDRAMECNRIRAERWDGGSPPRYMLRTLLREEERAGVPESLRGLLLANACHESGYYAHAEGDHRFSKKGKAVAIGLYQQWPWFENKYGIDRANIVQSTQAQLAHWADQISKVRTSCGFRTKHRLWRTAQVRAVRRPPGHCIRRELISLGVNVASLSESLRSRQLLPLRVRMECFRCYESSKHYGRYVRWRKSWAHLLN